MAKPQVKSRDTLREWRAAGSADVQQYTPEEAKRVAGASGLLLRISAEIFLEKLNAAGIIYLDLYTQYRMPISSDVLPKFRRANKALNDASAELGIDVEAIKRGDAAPDALRLALAFAAMRLQENPHDVASALLGLARVSRWVRDALCSKDKPPTRQPNKALRAWFAKIVKLYVVAFKQEPTETPDGKFAKFAKMAGKKLGLNLTGEQVRALLKRFRGDPNGW